MSVDQMTRKKEESADIIRGLNMINKETDELRIESKFLRMIVSKLIVHFIKKKVGKDIDLKVEKLYLKSSDDDKDVMFNLQIRGQIGKNNLNELVNGYLKEEK